LSNILKQPSGGKEYGTCVKFTGARTVLHESKYLSGNFTFQPRKQSVRARVGGEQGIGKVGRKQRQGSQCVVKKFSRGKLHEEMEKGK